MRYILVQIREAEQEFDRYWITNEQFGYARIPNGAQVIQFWVYEK